MKRYNGDGFSVLVPDNSCLFCKHCTEFFWDYTHGPYLFFCEVYDVATDDCEAFEEDIDECGEENNNEQTCRDISVDKATQFYCSECECTVDVPLLWGEVNYCPNCGAKVVGE